MVRPLLSRRLVPLLLLGFLALTALVPAAPARAHDSLISSNPGEGDLLDAAPAEVSMMFTAEVKTIGARVVVQGPDGEVQEGQPRVEGTTVTQPLTAALPDGAYTITWRVTSSDGHPISGEIPFTVRAGSGGSGGGGAGGRGSAGPDAGAQSAQPAAAEDEAGVPWNLLLIGGGVLGAVGGAALLLRPRR